METYQDKVAVVTGGSSGIGLGIARALAERGARVALIGTDPEKLAAARAHFAPDRALAIRLDVRDVTGWHDAVARVRTEMGEIDVLLLNAGAQGSRGPIEALSEDEWRWVWDVNVGGVYNGLRACLPEMKRRGTPAHVIATSSIAALVPRATVSAYGASKAAVVAIMEALRLELAGTAIGTSVFCPALVRTEFFATMERHAPSATADTFAYMRAFEGQGLDPLEVGRYVLDAMAAGRFYILSHPEMWERVEPRLREITDAFRDQATIVPAYFAD
jgi:NADP-dependent 3-hydroxy acid dehydrogenase YdfG